MNLIQYPKYLDKFVNTLVRFLPEGYEEETIGLLIQCPVSMHYYILQNRYNGARPDIELPEGYTMSWKVAKKDKSTWSDTIYIYPHTFKPYRC